eukprot:COSAG06_NODE_3404_length_5394_cov_6.648914_7_plen_86_part_00
MHEQRSLLYHPMLQCSCPEPASVNDRIRTTKWRVKKDNNSFVLSDLAHGPLDRDLMRVRREAKIPALHANIMLARAVSPPNGWEC